MLHDMLGFCIYRAVCYLIYLPLPTCPSACTPLFYMPAPLCRIECFIGTTQQQVQGYMATVTTLGTSGAALYIGGRRAVIRRAFTRAFLALFSRERHGLGAAACHG